MQYKIFIPLLWDPSLDDIKLNQDEPVWRYTLRRFKRYQIYLDTIDSGFIKRISEDPELSHVKAYLRDPDLSDPQVPINDLIRHFLDRYRIRHEVIGQIHANRPFLRTDTLEKAFDSIEVDGSHDSVVGADRFQLRLWAEDKYGAYPVNHNPLKLRRSSNLPTYWVENSSFYVFHAESFLTVGNRVLRNPLFFDTDFLESYVIENMEDMNRLIDIRKILRSSMLEDCKY